MTPGAARPARPAIASVLLTLSLPDAHPAADALLTSAERDRAAAFRDPADRRDFEAAHVLARQVAGRLLGLSPGRLAIVQNCGRCGGPHGRPLLDGYPHVSLSLAHTRGAVLAAASRSPVGVDIESLQRPHLEPSLTDSVLTPAEQREVRQSEDPQAAFLRQWVRKEALVKLGAATLSGLADLDLSELGISGAPDPAPVRRRLGPRWPGLELLDQVDAGNQIAFAVIARQPVQLTVARASP